MNRNGASLDAQAEPDLRAGLTSGPTQEEQVPATSPAPNHHDGTIRHVRETSRVVAVCLEGDFNLTNALALDAQIQLALGRGDDLIVDLSDASFIDCSVIHVIARAVQTAKANEQAIILQAGTAAIVERVLEVVKIEQVLPRAHSREEALRLIRRQAASP